MKEKTIELRNMKTHTATKIIIKKKNRLNRTRLNMSFPDHSIVERPIPLVQEAVLPPPSPPPAADRCLAAVSQFRKDFAARFWQHLRQPFGRREVWPLLLLSE